LLEAEQIREMFEYDQQSGRLFWRDTFLAGQASARLRPRPNPGDEVKLRHLKVGYWYVSIFQKVYLAHRVIWALQTGRWPRPGFVIDHVDRNRLNNRWANLREATPRQSICNTGMRRDNRSGARGVHFNKQSGKWRADIYAYGDKVTSKQFQTLEDAISWREQAAREAYGEFLPRIGGNGDSLV
jgi:hypothetical protein